MNPNTSPLRASAPAGVPDALRAVGVVVIGRNEGPRLGRCLESLREILPRTVYVDSGSTDGSVKVSRSFGVATLELDADTPFTAARARNAGFRLLLRLYPAVEYVQFVDGDCEIAPGWLRRGVEFIAQHHDVAVVWGRRREKYPERSVYNLLCDLEWQEAPLGETAECGGDALIRARALGSVNGYRADLICGEEPELCVRLRRDRWRVWHLDAAMTMHDAAMYHFRQWWLRMQRGGYAFAQGAHLHGAAPERHWIFQSRRAWLWGLCMPVAALSGAALFGYPALLLLLAYPLQILRIALRGRRARRDGIWRGDRWLRATALVLAKFPEALGQISFVMHSVARAQSRLIEYK